MLEHKADENVVEALLCEGQIEHAGRSEGDVSVAGGLDPRFGSCQGIWRDINRDDLRLRVAGRQENGLGADPTAAFEDAAARRVAGVMVQQLAQRLGLVGQSSCLSARISVDVA